MRRTRMITASDEPHDLLCFQKPPKAHTEDDGLDFTGIEALTPTSQIKKVESLNNLAINGFGWDKGVIVYGLSKQPLDTPRINLMLIEKAGMQVPLHLNQGPKPASLQR